MKLREVVEILDGKLLFEGVNLEIDIPCAFGSDLISDILMSTKEPTLLLTGLVNPQIIRVSDMIDLFGVVLLQLRRMRVSDPWNIFCSAKQSHLRPFRD